MLCDRCEQALIEIDHYGERLTGCLECNSWRSNKRAFIVEVSIEDCEALPGSTTNATSTGLGCADCL